MKIFVPIIYFLLIASVLAYEINAYNTNNYVPEEGERWAPKTERFI